MTKTARPLVGKILWPLSIVLLWEAAVQGSRALTPVGFPAFSDVLGFYLTAENLSTLQYALGSTLGKMLYTFTATILFGTAFGLVQSMFPRSRTALGPWFVGISSVPSICWVPLSGLLFTSIPAKTLFVVIMGAGFSCANSIRDAILSVPQAYVNVARTMGATRSQLLASVYWPAAQPFLIGSMRILWALGWRSLLAAELFFAPRGLAWVLREGQEKNQIATVVAGLTLIALFGLLVETLLFDRFTDRRARGSSVH